MKNLSFIVVFALAVMFTACQEEGTEINVDDLNVSTIAYDANSDAVIAASLEEVDQTTDEGIERIFGIRTKFQLGRLDCADVTRDSATQTITIDFGDGCTDPRGITRSGKIIISHSGTPRTEGAARIVTFEAFVVDSIQIDGVRSITNVTDSASAAAGIFIMNTKLEGGVITFSDNSTITREASHTRTSLRGETREESYSKLTGSASGTLQDGTAYTSTITEEIVFGADCDMHVPVSGVKEFVAGDTNIMIDFGDGACDNLVDVTTNGVTETIELEGRMNFAKDRDDHHEGKGGRRPNHGHRPGGR